jgi:hypothetical protein
LGVEEASMLKSVSAVTAALSLGAMSLYAGGCGSSSGGTPSDGGEGGMVHHPDAFVEELLPFDGSEGSDGGVDAAVCEPGSVSGVKFGLNPSAASAGKCTSEDITTIVNDCFGGSPDAGTTACNDILVAHTPIYTCFYSCITLDWSSSAAGYASTPWGALLNILSSGGGVSQYLNIGGCIVAAGGGNAAATTCGEDYEKDLECDLQACGANCSVPETSDPATDTAYQAAENALNACISTADPNSATGGECSKYSAAINTDCASDSGPVGSAFNTCVTLGSTINDPNSSSADFVQAVNQFFNILCSPGASDGGTTDGGAKDGGEGG